MPEVARATRTAKMIVAGITRNLLFEQVQAIERKIVNKPC